MHRVVPALVLLALLGGCKKNLPVVRDPLVVEQHRSRITKVRNAIEETRGVIAESRGAPYLPELYMRLAELTSEEARYHYMVAAEREQGEGGALHVPQVRVLKEQAIGTYNLILERYPNAHLTDRILFNISQEQRELGQFDEMRGSLERLVREFPNSAYHAEALLVLGNYHFDKNQLPTALKYFQEIVDRHRGALLGLAHYRLGWVYVNMADCELALTNFELAIDAEKNSDGATGRKIEGAALDEGALRTSASDEFRIPDTRVDAGFAGHEAVDVKREALVDLAYCYAQVRPPEEAADYLRARASSREAYVAALGKMANRFALIEQPRGQAQVVRELLRLAPDDVDRLDDARMLHNVVTRMDDYSSVGEDVRLMLRALRRRTMRPDYDVAAGKRTAREFDAMTRDLATKSHAVLRGEREGGEEWTEEPASYPETTAAYTAWLATFARSPYRIEMEQNLADALFESESYFDAGHHYRETARLLEQDAPMALALAEDEDSEEGEELEEGEAAIEQEGPQVRTAEERATDRIDALFNASVAYQRSLDAEGGKTHRELTVARAGLREAGSAFLTLGNPGRDKAIRIKFAIGRSYYEEGDYLPAIDLLTAVAYEYPGTEQGDAAANMVLDSYNTINDISGLFAVGRRFLAPESPISPGVKAQIQPIVDAAEQRRLDELSLAASGDSAGGMEVLMAFADRYKDSDLGERALLGTFVAARAAGDTQQLYNVGDELLKQFSRSSQAAGVAATLGQTAAGQFEFDRAIGYLEQAANLSEDRTQGAAYLLAAGEMREQLADARGAFKDYREALAMAGEGQTKTDAIVHLADLTERNGTPGDVVKLLQPMASGGDPEVLARLGLALLRTGNADQGEMYCQQVVGGAAAASVGASARAYYGVAESTLRMLQSYQPPSDLDAIEETIGMIEITIQSFLAAARQADITYSQASLSRLGTAADTGSKLIRSIRLPATLSPEEASMLQGALEGRAVSLEGGRDEALGECGQRALSTYRVDDAGRACLTGTPPQQDPVRVRPMATRQQASGLPDLSNAKERLARNPTDVDALREVGKAYLEAGDAHTARLVLGRAVDAGGDNEDLNMLGIASYRSGDQLGAQDAFGRAGAAGSGAAMRNLAFIYKKLGLDAAAEDLLLEAPPGKGMQLEGVQ